MRFRGTIAAIAAICMVSSSAAPALYCGLPAAPVITASAEDKDGAESGPEEKKPEEEDIPEEKKEEDIPEEKKEDYQDPFRDMYETVGDLSFQLYDDHAEVFNCSDTASGDIVIPSEIKGLPVTAIQSGAFNYNSDLVSVTIPDSVTVIYNNAFYCSGMQEINFPDTIEYIGANAFAYSVWLENQRKKSPYVIVNDILVDGRSATGAAIVPEGVKKICDEAFYDCNEIASIVLPEGLEVIGSNAFKSCINIKKVIIPDSVREIGSGAFNFCSKLTSVTLPDGLTEITPMMFGACSSLTSVEIPGSVTTIGDDAFYDCKSLESVSVPAGLRDILFCAFSGCSSLKEFSFPDGLDFISANAFEGCTSLKAAVLPESLTTLEICAFMGCSALEKVVIPDSITFIKDYTFSHCSALSSLELPASLEVIGEDAFSYCTNLRNVTIPDGTSHIGKNAFNWCSRLSDISLPSSLKKAGCFAFDNTALLKRLIKDNDMVIIDGILIYGRGCKGAVTIPDGVRMIADGAFYNCTDLTSATTPKSLKSIGEDAFYGCENMKWISVPADISVHRDSFYGCFALNDVYYAGTEEQWNKLDIISDYDSRWSQFVTATTHFGSAGPVAPASSGDANLDGVINVSDAVAVLQYITNGEKYPLSAKARKNADCDGDTGITGNDAIMIQKYDAGLIDKFPPAKS